MTANRLAPACCFAVLMPGLAAIAQAPPLITAGDVTAGLRRVHNLANYPTPIDLTHAGDGSNRIFIATQNGHVFVTPKGSTTFPQVFLDLSGNGGSAIPLQYGANTEKGLLGMAFHPDFPAQGAAGFGKFYTHTSEAKAGSADFTHPEIGAMGGDHHGVIREWTVDPGNPNRIDTSVPSRILMRIAQPQSNHNGGSIRFGPDKNLYIAMGDGGGGNDFIFGQTNGDGHTNVIGNGQDPNVVYGKILRIDPLGTNGRNGQYGVPADNPFASSDTDDARVVFASGLRNPFRASFDRVTGAYYVGDVGQGNREEVNIIESGRNYGWVYMEGTRENLAPPHGAGPFEPPIAEYRNNGAPGGGDGNAVIGGFVYRGTKVPELYGRYVFGDLQGRSGTGRLFHTSASGGTISELQYFSSENVATPSGALYSFGEDQDGELYTMFTGGEVSLLLAQAWGRDGGGSWNTAANWIGPMPNGAGHVANFLTELITPSSAPATITLDGNKTVGTLRFNNTVTDGVDPNSYIIAGGTGGTLRIVGGGGTPPSIEVLAGTHTIAAPVELTSSTINVAAGSLLNFTGDVALATLSPFAPQTVTKTGPGTANVATPLDLSAGHLLSIAEGVFEAPAGITGGDVTVQPGAALMAGPIALNALRVRGSAETGRIADDGNDAVFTFVNVQGPDTARPASLRSGGIRADELNIGHGRLTIAPSGADADTTVISSLNMTEAGSTIDLTDNDLILHAGPGGPTSYAAMRILLEQARNGAEGRWRGPGITSSTAAENPHTGLALVLNSTLGDGEARPIFSNISGEPTVLNDVIVKHTWNGDANLDGIINFDDYFRIDSAFLAGSAPHGWYDGDFNYDGRLDFDDYFLIDSAFLEQDAALAVSGVLQSTSVPEPTGALSAASASLLLLTRRRKP